jgi:hypothetical protein
VISGRVHDVGQAQARMENIVYGYINLATLVQLGEEAVFRSAEHSRRETTFDEKHIERVAGEVKTLIESPRHAGERRRRAAAGKHPHSDLTGMLLLAMSSFGLFVLVLSGILVVNLLTAMMASQVRQIGVMKAIGGTRWQIARIYFGQALFLGIAAVIVSIPLGCSAAARCADTWRCFSTSTSTVTPCRLGLSCWSALSDRRAADCGGLSGLARDGVPVRVALDGFRLGAHDFRRSAFDRRVARIGGTFQSARVSRFATAFARARALALTLVDARRGWALLFRR